MRSDMKKVIIERPRMGGIKRPNRKNIDVRNDLDEYGYLKDETPRKLSAKRDACPGRWGSGEKQLNDLLSPLRRFLRKNVGRPWNKVWSEICENNKDYMGKHLKDHVEFEVETNIHKNEDGEWVNVRGWKLYRGFYVDPDTGLLQAVKREPKKRYEESKSKIVEMNGQEYYKHDDVWYRVKTEDVKWEEVPRTNTYGKYTMQWNIKHALNANRDVFHLVLPSWESHSLGSTLRKSYGKVVLCVHKEQANSKECKRLNKIVQEREAA